jgi:hypothetical protein
MSSLFFCALLISMANNIKQFKWEFYKL